jgi:hypothetical protein
MTAPDASLTTGFAEPAPAGAPLTIEQRVAALENSVSLLNAHAAQMQGKIGLLAFEIAIDVLTRIRDTPDPAETLRVYLDIAQKKRPQDQSAGGPPICRGHSSRHRQRARRAPGVHAAIRH